MDDGEDTKRTLLISMKENTLMTRSMDMGSLLGHLETYTKDFTNLMREKEMEK